MGGGVGVGEPANGRRFSSLIAATQARGGEERGGKRARKGKVRVWVRIRVRRSPCYVVLRNVI